MNSAEMFGEEFKELLDVAPIGFERLRRIAPLVAEMGEPLFDFGGDFRGGESRAARPPPPIRSGVNSSGDPVFCGAISTGFPLARE